MVNENERAALFDVCDLDGLLAPPPKKKAKKSYAFESYPGLKAEILDDFDMMKAWRHDLHANPELGFEEHRTSDLVAKMLRAWNIEVHVGVVGGPTGVVGVLKGKAPSAASIMLRADMDALPMQDDTKDGYQSRNNGVHHGCGHDGHTSMLLGAAKYLSSTQNFSGTVTFVF